MSMRDLGLVAERIITEHPEYYTYFAETEFDYENRAPANRFNRNPILGMGIGADGLKTGHTQEAGFGLVGSAVQGDRRVTFVISGLDSAEARARESERIINWAFRQFVMEEIAREGTEIARAPVFMGMDATVGLAPAESVEMLVPALLDPRDHGGNHLCFPPCPRRSRPATWVGELVIHQGRARRDPHGAACRDRGRRARRACGPAAHRDGAAVGARHGEAMRRVRRQRPRRTDDGSMTDALGLFISLEGIDGSGKFHPSRDVWPSGCAHGAATRS